MNFGVCQCDEMETPDAMSLDNDNRDAQHEPSDTSMSGGRRPIPDRLNQVDRASIGSRPSHSLHDEPTLDRIAGSEQNLAEIQAAVDEVRGAWFGDLIADVAIQDNYLDRYHDKDNDEDEFDGFVLLPPDPAWQ